MENVTILNKLEVPRRKESGAVLVLIAMMLITIFGLAALATELTSYSTAIAQARNNANLAALGALEESTAGEVDDYLSRAKARAQQISGFNFALESGAGGDIATASTTGAAENGKATLIAGKYYYAKPPTSNPCANGYPCFVPGVASGEKPSAFKVEGELYPSHIFNFARIAFGEGAATKPIKVQSTATVVPRRGCFLVAGSPSNEIRLTHLLSGPDQAETAYLLAADNPSLGSSYSDTKWAALAPDRGGVTPASRYDTKHFQSDYQLSSAAVSGGVISDADYDSEPDFAKYHPAPPTNATEFTPLSALQERIWRWDLYPPDTINDYNGPEPMGTIFEGLIKALEIYKERAVTGDEACVIFFQRTIRWPAVIKLTSDFDYLLKLVDASKWPNRTAWLANLYRHNIFPELFSQTDMRTAIAEATQQFQAQKIAKPGMPSADFIVLISDGIQTCYTCAPPTGPVPFDVNGDKVVNDDDKAVFDSCYSGALPPANCAWADANGDGFVENDNADKAAFDKAYADPINSCSDIDTNCGNTYINYSLGMSQVLNLVRENVVPQQIPIHVIQVGQHVTPYSTDIEVEPPQSPAKCYSEYEKRSKGKSSVPVLDPGCVSQSGAIVCDNSRANDFNCRNPGAPGCTSTTTFSESNSAMYQLAFMTNGLWAPIRPPGGGCTAQEKLVGKCTPGPVYTDPKCRSTQEQMTEYITEIMGQNPFTIVEQ